MVLTRIYKLLLHLYPDEHRCTFGAEMTEVFQRAHADVCNQRLARRVVFCVRELSGLILDAFRAQTETTGGCREPWVWSLEGPVIALLAYAVCVWRAEEMGIWGFFFPGTYILVAVLGGLAAWIVGRNCMILRSWHQRKRALVIFFLCSLVLPIVARASEEAWARFLLARNSAFAFHLPGIQVVVEQGSAAQSQTPGLTFSRVLVAENGHTMTMLHHTDDHTPFYLFYGAVLAATLALWSRRTVPLLSERRTSQ